MVPEEKAAIMHAFSKIPQLVTLFCDVCDDCGGEDCRSVIVAMVRQLPRLIRLEEILCPTPELWNLLATAAAEDGLDKSGNPTESLRFQFSNQPYEDIAAAL